MEGMRGFTHVIAVREAGTLAAEGTLHGVVLGLLSECQFVGWWKLRNGVDVRTCRLRSTGSILHDMCRR